MLDLPVAVGREPTSEFPARINDERSYEYYAQGREKDFHASALRRFFDDARSDTREASFFIVGKQIDFLSLSRRFHQQFGVRFRGHLASM